ncbi:MAG: arylesterase [Parvularculales bacterium]
MASGIFYRLRHILVTLGLVTLVLAAGGVVLALLLADSPSKATGEKVLLAFGDSLTAGYGLPARSGFTRQLETALRARGHNVRIINGGVSGDTTAEGRARLDWTLTPDTDGVILELGANDALRGVDPSITEENLKDILSRLGARNLPVLLTGMYAPPNMGISYMFKFNGIYSDLADEYDVVFYPFFLEDVAAKRSLNLPDGIHPNAKGVEIIVENIVPYVEELLERIPPS